MQNTYLILGASSELGVNLIRALIEQDRRAVIYAHYNSNKKVLEEVIKKYPAVDIKSYQADLSSLDSTRTLIDEIKKENNAPMHIVNFSACAYRFNRLNELEFKRFDVDMTIQVYSFAMICQAFIPTMVERGYGKIISMLSAATKGIPPKNTTEYTTVKYALLGFLKSLAADYGDAGIGINGISPGMIETKFIKGIGRKIREYNAEKCPQHRNLQVDDVIPAILFLLSENSTFMNGTNLNLTGYVE